MSYALVDLVSLAVVSYPAPIPRYPLVSDCTQLIFCKKIAKKNWEQLQVSAHVYAHHGHPVVTCDCTALQTRNSAQASWWPASLLERGQEYTVGKRGLTRSSARTNWSAISPLCFNGFLWTSISAAGLSQTLSSPKSEFLAQEACPCKVIVGVPDVGRRRRLLLHVTEPEWKDLS